MEASSVDTPREEYWGLGRYELRIMQVLSPTQRRKNRGPLWRSYPGQTEIGAYHHYYARLAGAVVGSSCWWETETEQCGHLGEAYRHE